MKTVEEYMCLPYTLEIVPDPYEGGYAARFPELPGCITVGETIESVRRNAQDAKRAWLEAALEDGAAIPLLASDNTWRSAQSGARSERQQSDV